MLSWYYFQIYFSSLVTIPVDPVITGMTKHFIFHSRWISTLTFLYFHFSAVFSFITFLSDGISTSISKHIWSGYLSVPLDSIGLLHLHVYIPT